ncbi:MAG: glycosyltransferase family 2 protein [Acidimicrobiia bacterium]|nr:glycosyltransferase family 2 protein [Acidimicrobiia bacterium]
MTAWQPRVSVIIPAKDAAETLPKTLRAINKQGYPDIVEVIVAAADAATARVAAEEGARVVDNPSGTTPAGLNLAIRASSGEVIVRCDAHAVLPPDYVSRAVETIARTGAENVGGMQVPVGETAWEKAIAAAMSSPLGAGDARYRIGGEEGPTETVYLGVFRRKTLESLSGYDERFLRAQDYELNHRIIRSGGLVWFDPELRVEYRPRGSLGSLARQYFQYGQAKRLMWRAHPGSLKPRQWLPPLVVIALMASMPIALLAPWVLAIPAGYVAALLLYDTPTDRNPLRTALALATMHFSWALGFLIRRPG